MLIGPVEKENNLENRLNRILAAEIFDFSEYRKEANVAATTLKEEIQKEEGISVDRTFIAGSIGKGTALGIRHNPDLDIVLLLNEIPDLNRERPLDEIIQIIAKAARRAPGFKVEYETRFSVKCQYRMKSGCHIDFDVVPGFNLVTGAVTRLDLTNLERIMRKLAEDPERLHKWFSSSLVETTLNFVGGQSKFVKDCVILAKLWAKAKIHLDKRVPGKSYTIELIAIDAAQKEEEKRGENAKHVRAFVAFLRFFDQKKRRASIQFPFPCNPNIKHAYEQYSKMQKTKGKVLDPANPYNNLLKGFEGSVWGTFNHRAKHALLHIMRDGEKNARRKPFSLEFCFEEQQPRVERLFFF